MVALAASTLDAMVPLPSLLAVRSASPGVAFFEDARVGVGVLVGDGGVVLGARRRGGPAVGGGAVGELGGGPPAPGRRGVRRDEDT